MCVCVCVCVYACVYVCVYPHAGELHKTEQHNWVYHYCSPDSPVIAVAIFE